MDSELPSGSGRSRGRPRKASEDEPQEEKRAKGRLAQRTYMQRKQAETDKLRKRISSLEDAIEEMSDEFLKFGERVVNGEEASGSAGSERSEALDHLRGTTERFLNIARVAEKVAGDEGEQDAGLEEIGPGSRPGSLQGGSAEALSSKSPRFISSDMNIHKPYNMNTSLPPPNSISHPHMSISQQIQPNTGRFSPRLSYGLLSGSLLQPSALTNLWTHYTVSGPSSFALRLYTDTLILMFRVLRGEISNPGFIPSIARFRFKYETPDTFLSLAENQLSRMRISESNPNLLANKDMRANPNQIPSTATDADAQTDADSSVILFGPSHPVMSAPLRAKIHSEVDYEIGSMSEWLDPWNTQQYLLSRWGLRCSYAAARISAERWAGVNPLGVVNIANDTLPAMLPGSGSSFQALYPWGAQNQHLDMENVSEFFGRASFQGRWPRPPDFVFDSGPLAEKLIKEAVCFGEGPRFFKENIDKAVREFQGRNS
ncbi:hypothetical protein DL98DRAFT_592335 [Cadophora sp. DSE1049]|nr:hypothetical protein DL98DRAFT_592335 [Cadophora sp. DSE1049]